MKKTTTKSPRIEAHGTKGMKNTPWRRSFTSAEALETWLENNDAVVLGFLQEDGTPAPAAERRFMVVCRVAADMAFDVTAPSEEHARELVASHLAAGDPNGGSADEYHEELMNPEIWTCIAGDRVVRLG